MSHVPVRHGNDAEHRRLIANEINRLNRSKIITVADADMSNSWVAFDATRQPRYWKDGFGTVHLSGIIKDGTSMSSLMFTLKEGYRPVFNDATGPSALFPVVSVNAFALVYISYTGTITGSVGSTSWVTLDGITFKAA